MMIDENGDGDGDFDEKEMKKERLM